jgi:hypothetical protein
MIGAGSQVREGLKVFTFVSSHGETAAGPAFPGQDGR